MIVCRCLESVVFCFLFFEKSGRCFPSPALRQFGRSQTRRLQQDYIPVILNAKSARESKKKQHGHTAPTPAKQAEGVGRRYRWQVRRLEVNEMTRFGPFKPKWTFLQTKKIPVGLRAWPRADCPSSRPCGAVQVCVLFVFFSDCSPTSHESKRGRAAGVWPGKATRKTASFSEAPSPSVAGSRSKGTGRPFFSSTGHARGPKQPNDRAGQLRLFALRVRRRPNTKRVCKYSVRRFVAGKGPQPQQPSFPHKQASPIASVLLLGSAGWPGRRQTTEQRKAKYHHTRRTLPHAARLPAGCRNKMYNVCGVTPPPCLALRHRTSSAPLATLQRVTCAARCEGMPARDRAGLRVANDSRRRVHVVLEPGRRLFSCALSLAGSVVRPCVVRAKPCQGHPFGAGDALTDAVR